uniref:Putative 8.9 kDa secreted protein n=1 Tax=Ixodes ricinus TaxID=34613 RepID=A0A090XDV7_IXORI
MRTIVLLAVIALGGASQIMEDCNHHHEYRVSFEKGTCKYRNQTLKDRSLFKINSSLVKNGFAMQHKRHLQSKGALSKTMNISVPVYRNNYRWPH